MLLQPAVASLLGDNPTLQEIQADGSLSILDDNMEATDAELASDTLIGNVAGSPVYVVIFILYISH